MCLDGIFCQLAIGLGLVAFTIYTKIAAFSVTAKGEKCKKKSAERTQTPHE